jgi:hypothetical protein
MHLAKDEIYELQEKLLLIYKFINQNKMYKELYYQGIEVKQKYEDDEGLINELIAMDGAEELLKNCILELEEMKKEKKFEKKGIIHTDDKFQQIYSSQDWNFLYRLYEMKNLDDIGKLDFKLLHQIDAKDNHTK